jgi:polar amino acid transport system substrate-binding protein
MRPFASRSCHAVVIAVVGTLLLSACGTDGAAVDKTSLHDRLPEALRTAGVIRVGGSFTAAPVIFKNPQGQPDGLDVDLAAAMEKVLDIRFEFEDAGPFANVLPGLFEKKYDIGMSGITDTRERQLGVDKNDKQINDGVDFVDYFMAGIGIVVREGNPKSITTIDGICGRTVAVKKGTTHHDLVSRQQKACENTGKPLKILETGSDAEALEHVRTSAADVYVTDYPKAQHNAMTIGEGKTYDLGGPQIQSRPFGIAVRKSDRELRDVLMKAMNALIRNGTYDELLAKRQLTAGAIQNSVVNGSL